MICGYFAITVLSTSNSSGGRPVTAKSTFGDDAVIQFGGGTLGHPWGNAVGAAANRVAAEACVKARNEGRHLEKESREILTEAASHSPELAAAMETWKEIQNYGSRFNDVDSKKFGTCSYLPEMDASSIRKQIEFMIKQDWHCAVEHVEPERAAVNYWYMWKLPLFGERDIDVIMNELTAFRNANRGHHIRVIAYDNKRQTQGQSMVVYRGDQ